MAEKLQQQQKRSDVKTRNDLIEFNDLSAEQKVRYLRAYWTKASDFLKFKEFVLPDEQIYAQLKKFKEKPEPEIRRVVKLDFWKWKLDSELTGVREGYFRSNWDDSTWENVVSPHNVNYAPIDPVMFGKFDQDYAIYLGEFALWYRASVLLTKQEIEGKRAFLSFESCSIKTTVWVNEWPVVLEHFGVYPFQTEITEELSKTITNQAQVTLEVVSQANNARDFFYNWLKHAYAEKRGDKNFESPCLNWGGINGSVELTLTSPSYIKDVFIYTKEITEEKSTLCAKLEIDNTTTDEFQGKILLRIGPWYPEEIHDKDISLSVDVKARPLGVTLIEKEFEIHNPILWDSWKPNLYITHATLVQDGGGPCDDLYETFGIRTFTAKEGKFYLNGSPIFMAATHDQGNYPDASPTCPDDYWLMQDFLLTKSMGFVAARHPSDNRIHYRRIAELADQLGIMLFWEGYCSVWMQHPSIDELATRDVPLMIRDLRNHPSIIAWVMGDETFYSHPQKNSENTYQYQNRRERYNELVQKLATDSDPSRLINPVGCWAEDLAVIIEKLISNGLSLEEARKKALKMLQVFDAPNVYWSLHTNPGHTDNQPVYALMKRFDDILCGAGKAVTFDEFGCEAMPDWELVSKGEWWHDRWTRNGGFLAGRFKILEETLIGKKLELVDWQISQAYQATILWRAISYMRETGAYAGFGTGCLRDVYNFYIGLVDFQGRAKLAFFVTKNALERFFISGMHGNYVFGRGDGLSISVVNSGSSMAHCKLKIKISNEDGKLEEEKTLNNLALPQGLTNVFDYELGGLSPDLYSAEYSLFDNDGMELGYSFDMFFVR